MLFHLIQHFPHAYFYCDFLGQFVLATNLLIIFEFCWETSLTTILGIDWSFFFFENTLLEILYTIALEIYQPNLMEFLSLYVCDFLYSFVRDSSGRHIENSLVNLFLNFSGNAPEIYTDIPHGFSFSFPLKSFFLRFFYNSF